MKKVLFATTALIATAGMAAADMTWSGGARFGVVYDEDQSVLGDQDEFGVHNRFTLNFDGTAETDSGAEFFARIRIRGENEFDGGNNSNVSGPRVGVRAGGFEVAVGNILGALESTPGLYDGSIGLTGLGYSNLPINAASTGTFDWDSFSSGGSGSNGIEVIYSANGFGFHLSHSESTERTAVHVSYKFSDWTVALGHQESDTIGEDMTVLTVAGAFGGVNVGLAHALNEGDFDATRLNASVDVGAATNIEAFVTVVQNDFQEDAYGIGFTHSLGGATLAGGIARSFSDQTVADLGVRFNF